MANVLQVASRATWSSGPRGWAKPQRAAGVVAEHRAWRPGHNKLRTTGSLFSAIRLTKSWRERFEGYGG